MKMLLPKEISRGMGFGQPKYVQDKGTLNDMDKNTSDQDDQSL